MTGYEEVATSIIQGQSVMIGNVAYSMADKVPGLDASPGSVRITGDPETVLDALVKEYSAITGPLGVRMCFQSAQDALSRHPEVKVASFSGFG